MIAFLLLACLVVTEGSGIHPEVHHPQPFSFGYTIKDKEGVQHRQEAGNGAGVVQGNYGFIDNKGLRRQVDYVADHGGFRASVQTNEPGTSGQSPAAVHMKSNDPYAHGAAVPYVSRVNDPVVPALSESHGVHGFPTLYGHRAYGHGSHQYVPAQNRHTFLTPVQSHMPLHVPEHLLGHHLPIDQADHHHVPVQMPIHGHNAHHVPVQMPIHGHMVHIPSHELAPMYGPHHSHIYGPSYMRELPQGHHRGQGGIVNFGANLVGGAIKGYDSRFTNLP